MENFYLPQSKLERVTQEHALDLYLVIQKHLDSPQDELVKAHLKLLLADIDAALSQE